MSIAENPPPGPQHPVWALPERVAGTVRRTSSIDILPVTTPDDGDGLLLRGTARDLYTGPTSADVLGSATAQLRIGARQQLTEVQTTPAVNATALLGARVGPGFRSALSKALPGDRGSLLYLLFDDAPVAALISGYRLLRERPETRIPVGAGPQADLCAGWRQGGTMLTAVEVTGTVPAPMGPPAPPLTARDPLGFHELTPMPPSSMRRHRRLDVGPLSGGTELIFTAWFRDTYTDPAGQTDVLHEYDVTGLADVRASTVLELRATPRVLPWPECPAAAASAQRMVGRPIGTLRDHVRDTLSGPATCTHLSDLLRGLDDLTPLADALRSAD